MMHEPSHSSHEAIGMITGNFSKPEQNKSDYERALKLVTNKSTQYGPYK
jgi:hypothetical protein